MSGVGGVSNATPVLGSSTISGGGLTTDEVMLYCASQLTQLDNGIKQHMAQQQVARNQADKLGKLKGLLSSGQIGAGDSSRKKEVFQAMKEAYDSLDPHDPRRDKLNDMFCRFMDTATYTNQSLSRVNAPEHYNLLTLDTDAKMNAVSGNGNDGNDVSVDEMKGFASEIEPMLSDISKGAELDMIDLQAKISQRQMAVQMATQMISKINETMMSIVQKI
jgi:hypothetical protein